MLFEADAPDHVEDVSATVETKIDALEAHESQFESTMKALDEEQLAAFRDRVRDRLAELGRPHGVGGRRGLQVDDRSLIAALLDRESREYRACHGRGRVAPPVETSEDAV